jgi:hypothetical protein
MNLSNIERVIKKFDEKLGIELTEYRDCYLYVSTDKHRYYIGYFNIEEIENKKDLMFYLDCIKAKEI